MAENTIRMSQLVGMFGPGAMLDLPDRSVLVLGLDHWEMQGKGTFQKIEEPRLQRLLHLRLKDDDRIVGDKPPEFRTPPIDKGDPKIAVAGSPGDGVSAMVRLRRHCRRCAEPSPARPVSGLGAAEAPRSSSAPTARSGRLRRSVSSAAVRTAICRTSTGVASSIRTCAARRRTPPTTAGACRKPMWLEDFGHQRRSARHARRLRMRGVVVAGGVVSAGPARRMLRRTAVDRARTIAIRTAATRRCGY